MNFYKIPLFLLIYFFFFSFLNADSSISQRMKERLPDVISAKDAGSIGENIDGLLLLRDSSSSSKIKELVESENKDRVLLFKHLADKTGADENDVARKFSKAIASKAKKGHWFKNSSGSWVSK